MHDHTLHRRRKDFYRYCLQAFTAEKILNSHINDCLKTDKKQMILMLEEVEYVKFKNYKITICDLCRFLKYSSSTK